MPHPNRYPPVTKVSAFLHGGDYNPDQWSSTPEVWDEDVRLMKLAGCNAMSVGIFSWSALEPEEGRYTFDWLDRIMDKLHRGGVYTVLATPSGSKPAWMSFKYPEVCRVNEMGQRDPHRGRHNHCRTSPVYREKCVAINTRLAQRYKDHPGLIAWHVSNEYNGGACFCDHCLAAFRAWLRRKYETLDNLNQQWWTSFWSHTFTDWSQIIPNDEGVHGLMLDWKRFCTDQTIDFFSAESAPLRLHTPGVPVTTNFMGFSPTLNYWEFAKAVDVVSWDSYPYWHDTPDDIAIAADTAMTHDVNRAMKGGRPFMLMENTPSLPSRRATRKHKRPGMNYLAGLQAVAHGSDTVQYFQWRMGRGGCEKFHGAVVDHTGTENTRVFREVAQLGQALARLTPVLGAPVPAQAALIVDWENRWAMEGAVALGDNVKHIETCRGHYQALWRQGIAMDVIAQTAAFTPYRLLIAPMLYLLKDGVAQRLAQFVANGGSLVMTYWSGIVNENDLCHLGGFPGGGLRKVLGVWNEETDSLQPFDANAVRMTPGNALHMTGSFAARQMCAVIHAETAQTLAVYESDYYAGQPALTLNHHGKGEAWYMASRNEQSFLDGFYAALAGRVALPRAVAAPLPHGVSAQVRRADGRDYVFLMNFTTQPQTVALGGLRGKDLLTGAQVQASLNLAPYGVAVVDAPAAES